MNSAANMKFKVEISPTAESEIEAVYNYIRATSPENDNRWRLRLYHIAARLSAFPAGCSYAIENDFVEFEIRQKLFGNYRILFTISDERVIIMSVRHAARRPMSPEDLQRLDPNEPT